MSALSMLPDLQAAGLEGSFVRLDATSDDLSLAINGVNIVRVFQNKVGSLPHELVRPEVTRRLAQAKKSYSDVKVAELLKYFPEVDYRVPEIPISTRSRRRFNPYYAYYRIMGMSADEFRLRAKDLPTNATPEVILAKKKRLLITSAQRMDYQMWNSQMVMVLRD